MTEPQLKICEHEITEEPLRHVDMTPNADFVLRILRAYRQNCNCKWVVPDDPPGNTNILLETMNNNCDQRAKLLDEAIAILEASDD